MGEVKMTLAWASS